MNKKLTISLLILVIAIVAMNLVFAAGVDNQFEANNPMDKATNALKDTLGFLNDLYQWINSKINFSKLIYFIKDIFVFIFELLIKSIRFMLSYLH